MGLLRSDRGDWKKGMRDQLPEAADGVHVPGEDEACCGIPAMDNLMRKPDFSFVPFVSHRFIDYLQQE